MEREREVDGENPHHARHKLVPHTQDVKLWDIIAELVEICTIPTPLNPFSVDLAYFERCVCMCAMCSCVFIGSQPPSLPPMEAIAASGAMIHMLQRVLDHSRHRYDDGISKDLDALYRMHFQQTRIIPTTK